MSRHKQLSAKNRVLVLCIATMSPLWASRLNPVSWSLQAQREVVAPGATVVLRLHAQIEDGYHLYSFTTPAGGPIRTTASLQSNSAIGMFRVYQPAPDRHRDPNLNVPVETFHRGVDFLLRATIANDAAAGDRIMTARVRYQACSNEICLAPAIRVVSATIRVEPGVVTPMNQIPSGYQLVKGSGE
jgi:Disulphide bond corrector protein DsbC